MTLAEFRKMSIKKLSDKWVTSTDLDEVYTYLIKSTSLLLLGDEPLIIFVKMSKLSNVELLLLGLKVDE